jgi:hypothetical protein
MIPTESRKGHNPFIVIRIELKPSSDIFVYREPLIYGACTRQQTNKPWHLQPKQSEKNILRFMNLHLCLHFYVFVSSTYMLRAARVARWFVFKPKISNLGKFWRALQW